MRGSYLLSFIALALGLPVATAGASNAATRIDEAAPAARDTLPAATASTREVRTGLVAGRRDGRSQER